MEISTDIAIIGCGLAAYAATVELQDSGRQVTIVAKAPGASAMNSGAWDIAGDPMRSRGQAWAQWPDWRTNLAELIRRDEQHPYSILARGSGRGEFGDFVAAAVARAAQALSLPLTTQESDGLAMVTDLGTVKPSAWVQASMRDADLKRWNQAKVLVVGIQGFPAFNARFIRNALLEKQESQTKTHVKFAGSLDLEMPDVGRTSLHAVQLAQHFDREAAFVKFGQEIVRYLEGKVYTHLLLPPVMGLENTAAILEALCRITGLNAAETLATPMSVPGWRLQQAMEKFFHDQRFERVDGEVVGFDSESRKIKALYIHQGEDRLKLRARAIVLASGKYLGGGVERRRQWREALFKLPLFWGDKPLIHQSLPQVTRRHYAETQPFLSAGIRINPFGQPLDADAQLGYDNLFAAGGILAGFNPSQGHCAAGVSLVSGTVAARHAAALV